MVGYIFHLFTYFPLVLVISTSTTRTRTDGKPGRGVLQNHHPLRL